MGRGHNAIKRYFWIQLKSSKFLDRLQSISLSFSSDNCLDVRVDIHQDNKLLEDSEFKTHIHRQHEHLLDIPLQEGTEYRIIPGDASYGSDGIEQLKKLFIDNNEDLPLLQVATVVDSLAERDLNGTIIQDAVAAVKKIKIYYDHLMKFNDEVYEKKN